MIITYLLKKEFIQIKRNAFIPRLIIMFPIMIMCVIPWVTNLEIKNINIVVVDKDRSTLSQNLTHRIEASNYFVFKGMAASYDDALNEMEKGDIDIIASIPKDYEKSHVLGKDKQVLIAANAVNGTKGGMGSSYLTNIVNDNVKGSDSRTALVKVSTLNLYNVHQNYKVTMIPALMAMIIVLLCGFLPALNIVGEKENGTIEQINVTPVNKATFILAKLIPYWLIAMVVMTLCFILSWAVYGITPQGNVFVLYLLAILLAFTISGIGLIVSNYSEAMQQAMFMMWFIAVCMILLSGLFTPIMSMPKWAQHLTYINPIRYFIEAMRNVFIRGGELTSIINQIAALGIYSVVINIWAVISYKKNN